MDAEGERLEKEQKQQVAVAMAVLRVDVVPYRKVVGEILPKWASVRRQH